VAVPFPLPPGTPRELHVSREARDRYRFDEDLFGFTGRALIAHFAAARRFAAAINARRDTVRHPEQAVSTGEIAAAGLIDEINHLLLRRFRERADPGLLGRALALFGERLGTAAVQQTLAGFCDEFPPVAVYRRQLAPESWLAGATGGEPHREAALEELALLWLNNLNPAFVRHRELFDDRRLAATTSYNQVVAGLREAFGRHPVPAELAGEGGEENILDLLRAAALAAPHSAEAQLRLLLARFGDLVGHDLARELLTALDVLKEEGRALLAAGGGFGAPAELRAAELPLPAFDGLAVEPEAFTADRAWMPRLVLLAKNVFVWLDQLSRRHRRPLATLAEIPDAELDELARRGITGLWLIGLWERSPASRRIKQLMGNPEAAASAYSLFDYVIAGELGGEAALADLAARAARRGIRLASDMVPNHVGIDGRWVLEHPEWFIQLPYPPFPSYSFDGPDLSPDPAIGIHLEDHYYQRSDAAVVFRRTDRRTGEVRYLYHGNDGTHMPWNDTAQLDYLRADVREAVIQTILRVARQFPIVRFDAAMTLAKRHYQRLWYPEPGTGGDIPSRAGRGLSRAEFDAQMPQEFWREVVDRCAAEVPETLLLAEAFWLMEGYFVRSLGMHRVYNSAFMVCLRDEENAKYRRILKETLEFDPEILYRFVNFVSNPDERTAVDQFGKGDKYFGVATLMATLPGLPMFGHGQIEGFAERYGMEYRRAYHDEEPDPWLLARHEREIFPLLHRRALFAGVEEFCLYDLVGDEGGVREDVFALSNRRGPERALVLCNNGPHPQSGRLFRAAPAAEKLPDGTKRLRERTLAEGLGLAGGPDRILLWREPGSGLEYLRPSGELAAHGFPVSLGPYQTRVLLDLRELTDADGRYHALAAELGERGVPSVEEALLEMALRPLHAPFAALLAPDLTAALLAPAASPDEESWWLATAAALPETEREEELPDADGGEAQAPDEPAADGETVLPPLADGVSEEAPAERAPEAAEEAVAPSLAADAEDGTGAEIPSEPAVDDLEPAASETVATALPEPARRLEAALATALRAAAEEAGIPEADREVAIAAVTAGVLPGVARLRALVAAARSDEESPAAVRLRAAFGPGKREAGLLAWLLLRDLGRLAGEAETGTAATAVRERTAAWFDDWRLGRVVARQLAAGGLSPAAAERAVQAVRLLFLLERPGARAAAAEVPALFAEAAASEAGRTLLGIHPYDGVVWLRREGLDELTAWLLLAARLETLDATAGEIAAAGGRVLAARAERAGYRLEPLLRTLTGEPDADADA